MELNELSLSQNACLLGVLALGMASIGAEARSRHALAISLLTAAALLLRLFAATLDPFLNDWDEVYHAVVAKNMVEHPMRPILFKEAALPTTTSWAEQHIWLHKPPFFLWQMALGINVIGDIPFAVRLPSVLWTTLMVPAVWRMGTLLRNERTGFVAAGMVAFSYLLQELVAGSINTDHNDAVFIGLITCATWVWLEHERRPSIKYAVAIGLLSACAILTKWYIGCLVFLPFGLSVLLDGCKPSALRYLGVALLIAIIPVGAWLWYITVSFPIEASYEAHENWLRWSIPLEGHRGGPFFHFDVIADLIPPLTWWILLPTLVWLIWRIKTTSHRLLLISAVSAVHLFFLIARTKMVCYTMVLLPFYCLAVANALVDISDRITRAVLAKSTLALATAGLCYFTLDFPRIIARHSLAGSHAVDPRWREQNITVTNDLVRLAEFLERHPKPILFNMPRNHNYRFMFASGIDAWPKAATPRDVQRLTQLGYTVFMLQDGAAPDAFPAGAIVVPDSLFSISRDVRM